MGSTADLLLMEYGGISGDNHDCRANRPQKKKNRAVQTEKSRGYGRKHAINIHIKTTATAIMSQENPLVADNAIPAVINKKGIKNGQRLVKAVIYLAIIRNR